MNGNLVKAQDIFLSRVNHICTKFGLNNVMAQLYAILYLSHKPLSLDDMVERLKISKGSVSVNIRALERYGAARKIWVKGSSRKDYYEAETDTYKVIMDRVKLIVQIRLNEADDMVKSSSHALNSVNSTSTEEKEAIRVFKERLDKLRKLQNKAQTFFNLFDSGFLNSILGTKVNRNNKKEALIKTG